MNLVSRHGAQIVIRQVPVLLFFVTFLFSLPLLSFSLSHIILGVDADGVGFCLVFGLLLLWLGLEFVATRERIDIDLERQVLTRTVSGVFRHKEQSTTLRGATAVGLEIKRSASARRQQYLYLYGDGDIKFLLNEPAKLYIDQSKLGQLLCEITHLPYREPTDPGR